MQEEGHGGVQETWIPVAVLPLLAEHLDNVSSTWASAYLPEK